MSLTTRVNAIFRKAWRRYGRPTMSVVPPLSAWSLPAGYTFDASRDGIVTSGGATLTDLDAFEASGYFEFGTVYIVPTGQKPDLDAMIAAGIAPSGQVEVWILQSDVDTVNAAFAVEIMGDWFNVIEAGRAPVGHGAGVWARVRLERRS